MLKFRSSLLFLFLNWNWNMNSETKCFSRLYWFIFFCKNIFKASFAVQVNWFDSCKVYFIWRLNNCYPNISKKCRASHVKRNSKLNRKQVDTFLYSKINKKNILTLKYSITKKKIFFDPLLLGVDTLALGVHSLS